jgi:MFS transporter, DHA1 family, tetracycline resistance protein
MSDTATTPAKRSPLLAIFLTVFIDMLGVGIIIPVIPALFFNPATSILPTHISPTQTSLLYGLFSASFPFMQFFGAPILGALSDRYGRKPMLQISLIGTLIGYILFALAIHGGNLPLLFVSRIIPGFFGGNIAILYSAISDVSDEQSKPKNFGLIGMAFGLGFILGPTIGGLLADKGLVSWFDNATPFWFTAILTLINLILAQFTFPETLTTFKNTEINPFSGIKNVMTSFQKPHLRSIFGVVLLHSLGFSTFNQFFSVYMIQKFGVTPKDIGMLYGWVGLFLVLTQGILVRRMSGKVAPTQILTYSLLGLSIILMCTLVPQQTWLFFLTNPIMAICQGLTAPNITATVSSRANPSEQGEVLGINQSMVSVGQVVPPLIAAYLNSLSPAFPIIMSSVLVFLGWVVFVVFFKRGADGGAGSGSGAIPSL